MTRNPLAQQREAKMPSKKRKLLIIEDDAGIRRQLGWTFSDYDVNSVGDQASAIPLVRSGEPPVILLDLGLPPDPDGASEGLATLEQIAQVAPNTKVIVVTGNEERKHALKAISLGAYDFYQKPIDSDTIRLIVDRAYNLHALESENRHLRERETQTQLRGVVTESPEMMGVCKIVEKVAPASASVVLVGESGTGKELIARALHERGSRAAKRFIAINCAAIPETLLESELFGYEKGAFTGAHKQVVGKLELADEGTFFLDEIGDMPMPLQAKLLRFLQERTFERIGGRTEISVDVRIICATNKPPEELIKAGRFREDLYFRLSEVVINIPPLRQRHGDPALVAHHFLHLANEQNKRRIRGFTAEALSAITTYNWPGNVRELENRVKRAAIMADGTQITLADLDIPANAASSEIRTLQEVRNLAEREAVRNALDRANGNLSQAAKLLDISRPTLYDLLRQHGLATS